MKKFAGTYAMAIIAVLLAGYTYWEFQHAREDLEAAKGERLAFTLKREDVDEIRLTLKGEKSVFRRVGDAWQITEPVQDQAEGTAVEGFLFTALAQRVKIFRGDDEAKTAPAWSDFGLEPPAAALELSAKGKVEALAVSGKNSYDGLFFVRQKDELLLGDRNLAQIAQRPYTGLRSRHLWRADDAVLSRVTISGSVPKETLEFAKGEQGWQMQPAPKFKFDPTKFETWVNKVEELLPSDFVHEGIDDQARPEYLLTIPSETIRIEYKKKDGTAAQWTLTLGQDKGNEVYLYTDQRPTLYKTSKSSVDGIRVDGSYFRDGKAPFQFDVELAREIRLTTPDQTLQFLKADDRWTLSGGSSTFPEEKLVQLLTTLRSLEAQEYVMEAGTGFKAIPQVQIMGDKGKLLFSMSWADEYKAKKPWNAGTPVRYARTSAGGGTFGVEKSKIDRLIDPALLPKKAKEEPK